MSTRELNNFVTEQWDTSALPALQNFIRIPNRSPDYDPDWSTNDHAQRAIELLTGWCSQRSIKGMTISVEQINGLTPIIFIEVDAFNNGSGNVLLYGHYDKQPPMTGWRENLDPYEPVIEGDRLYGRGAGDDGYAIFAAVLAIEAAQQTGHSHPHCVVVIEGSEESGSPHLAPYIDALSERIGSPEVIFCLDSGCADYEHLWITSSLRGIFDGILRVDMLTEGVHSGFAGGNIASTFRVLELLLNRLETVVTGQILVEELWTEIPQDRLKQARETANELGESITSRYPLVSGAQPVTDDPFEALLNETWRPSLTVTGIEGIPSTKDGGNVLAPHTALKLSFRLPPTVSPQFAANAVKKILESDPPYGAHITFTVGALGDGWNAPPSKTWLEAALDEASRELFGNPSRVMGEGGSIPFMGMLAQRYPNAQFVVTGVLGPDTNAHGPNEYLHIPTTQRLTSAIAHVLTAHQ